jgi:hypothetical protein
MTTALFWFIALAASLSYGYWAPEIFQVKATGKWPQPSRVHQLWVNFFGSVVGWATLYYLLEMRLRVFDKVPNTAPGAIDIALLLVAFLGVTGHLPYAFVGIASALDALVGRGLVKLTDRLRTEGAGR